MESKTPAALPNLVHLVYLDGRTLVATPLPTSHTVYEIIFASLEEYTRFLSMANNDKAWVVIDYDYEGDGYGYDIKLFYDRAEALRCMEKGGDDLLTVFFSKSVAI